MERKLLSGRERERQRERETETDGESICGVGRRMGGGTEEEAMRLFLRFIRRVMVKYQNIHVSSVTCTVPLPLQTVSNDPIQMLLELDALSSRVH